MCSPTAGRNCVCKVSHQRNKKGVRCCSLLSLSFTHSSKFIHSLIHCLLHLLTHFFTPSFSPVSAGVVQVADPANQPRDALWFIFEDDVQVRAGWRWCVAWVAVGEGGRGVGVLALLSCAIAGVMPCDACVWCYVWRCVEC